MQVSSCVIFGVDALERKLAASQKEMGTKPRGTSIIPVQGRIGTHLPFYMVPARPHGRDFQWRRGVVPLGTKSLA